MNPMVTIGPWTFNHVNYDELADVVYLSIGEPRRAVGEPTPEGHIALFDEATGEFCGLTLIGPADRRGPSTAMNPPISALAPGSAGL